MWGAPEEPPDAAEGAGGPSQAMQVQEPPVGTKEVCEDSKSQLETFKDIMLKNKNDLKTKEDKLQEYASKLSEIKSRAKLSRRSKDGGGSSVETTPKSKEESNLPKVENPDDVGRAKTPKAKSSLLQRKLAENRKVFEKRSKEMTANKRAVEEKVEAIRQQMDQTDMTLSEAQKESLTVSPVRPVLVAQIAQPPIVQLGHFQDKDNKIAELSNRILELEATVIDLEDNLKEKDSVIEAKTKAVTLMSADLSKKGKTTLDTLDETKDEMRTMQENFVLIETSLRGKNDNLLEQLHERNDRVTELETTIDRYEREMEEKRQADLASSSQSRTAMDTLADTRDAMRSMQENFVLVETSLKDKIDNLLQQLENREIKLAEAEARIYKLESGAGIESDPEIPDLRYKIERLELGNRALQDEKYELQKNIVELQEKIVARETTNGNGLIIEKDNRIAELENLIQELKNSNQLLEEESKSELEKRVVELTTMNDEFRSKIDDLEKINNDMEITMNEMRTKITNEIVADDENLTIKKLTKELDDLNKSMIKLKAQHKGKLRNLQKQLESFKMVSDANAELVKLGNQVALLEEEKGNLQLSLVDFDELKASAGDWQDRIVDLESKVSTQANDIQTHIEAIAILENQKLDLMQELHTVKQEISGLEAENAESENLRVTAEMKVVDLEEQLESLNSKNDDESSIIKSYSQTEFEDMLKKIENLTQENRELGQKLLKIDEKPSSESGSTESFETINDDKNEMLKKIEKLSSRNSELEEKLQKIDEGARSNVDSTESFETINDNEKMELVKKIEILTRENNDLLSKLNKFEEKGSSDAGSTESFEKIPEQGESSSRIEALTIENNELVIKLTKIMEKYENLTSQTVKSSTTIEHDETSEINEKLDNLVRENNDLVIKLTKVQEKLSNVTEEKKNLEKIVEDMKNSTSTFDEVDGTELKSRMDSLTLENNELIIKLVKMEEKNVQLNEKLEKLVKVEAENVELLSTVESTTITVKSLENEIEKCRDLITQQTNLIDDVKTKLSDKEAELERKIKLLNDYETSIPSIEHVQRELKDSRDTIDEWRLKFTEIQRNFDNLETEKNSIQEKLEILEKENKLSIDESKIKDETVDSLRRELENTIATLESRVDDERALIVQRDREITNLREIVEMKDQELHEKYAMLQNEMINIDKLQDNLNDCKTQIVENEKTIGRLNEEIEKLNEIVKTSNEEKLESQSEIIVLRDELRSKAAKQAENDEILLSLREKNNLVDETQQLLNLQIRENENLQNICDNANTEMKNLREILTSKDNEIASLEMSKSSLEENLRELEIVRIDVDRRVEILQTNLNESNGYIDDLKSELGDAYKMLELVKSKHTEDVDMQNRRLEDLIDDLNGKNSECEFLRRDLRDKVQECEILRVELDEKTKTVEELERKSAELEILRVELSEKNKIIGQNFTEETKIALEQRITDLQRKLDESEANGQAQLKKRKILAANLKKKSVEIVEHESRATQFETKATELQTKLNDVVDKLASSDAKISELEEKWITEKNEKDSANLLIQQMTITIEDRENSIVQLEEQLRRARDDNSRSVERVEQLSTELENSSTKIASLIEQTTEMGEEIDRLRLEIDRKSSQFETEINEKNRTIDDMNSHREKMKNDETTMQQLLAETTEKARELGVRMEVMETEYVQQLNTIQNLRTENGMLVSKQAQINEKLENTEKESNELKIRLDVLERENLSLSTTNTDQRDEATNTNVNDEPEITKTSTTTTCDHCDQCQTVVQALEAKLQERDAEIENLDNELANSIGNFVHMRESLRVSDLMNQSTSRNRNLEDARENNDLAIQYHAIAASNNDIREQLNSTTMENQRLKEKIDSLQAVNNALEERIAAVDAELIDARSTNSRSREIDVTHGELLEKLKIRDKELMDVKKLHEDWIVEARSKIDDVESENRRLTIKCDDLTRTNDILEGEIESLKTIVDRGERELLELQENVKKYKEDNAKLSNENAKFVDKGIVNASSLFDDKNDGPQLFDAAKAFGLQPIDDDKTHAEEIKQIRVRLNATELEKDRCVREAERLENLLVEQNVKQREIEENCQRLQNELTMIEEILRERDRQIASLNVELNNVGVQLAGQFDQRGNVDALESSLALCRNEIDEQARIIVEKDVAIENLSSKNVELIAKIENLEKIDCWYSNAINVVSSSLKNLDVLENDEITVPNDNAISSTIVEIVNEILHLSSMYKRERLDLIDCREKLQQTISSMVKNDETSNDSSRCADLEQLVEKITRERDIKQLQINDLTRSLEELQESLENSSSMEERRLRNLQASLDEALTEHERLKIEIETMRREKITEKNVEAVKISETETSNIEKSAESANARVNVVDDCKTDWDNDDANVDDEKIIEQMNDWDDNWPTDEKCDNTENICETASSSITTLQPSLEIILNTRIAELEDKIKDLETDKEKLIEEAKFTNSRMGKMVKKLKSFKIQNDGLQQQLKIQKASTGFGDLDSAIVDELKLQIEKLEKIVQENNDERKKMLLERENLSKKIDVLTSANERLIEMKERQDMEVEVLKIRSLELGNKLRAVEWQVKETCDDEDPTINREINVEESSIDSRQMDSHVQQPIVPQTSQSTIDEPSKTVATVANCLCKKYREDLEELRDELEALASENEQLQQLLEEQKIHRQQTETNYNEENEKREKIIETLSRQNEELEKMLKTLRAELETTKNQSETNAKISEERLTEILREKQEFEDEKKSYEEIKGILNDSMEQLTDLLNARVQEVAELKREMQSLKNEKNQQLVSCENLAEMQNRELNEKNVEIVKKLENCEILLTTKINELEMVENKLQQMEIERSNLIAELNEKNRENVDLRDKLNEMFNVNSNNSVDVKNFRDEIERLNAALLESKLHRESLQSELSNNEEQSYIMNDEIRKYNNEIERLNAIVNQAEKITTETIDDANRRIREIQDSERNLKKTIDELTTRENENLSQLSREINDKNEKITILQKTCLNLEEKMLELTSIVSEKDKSTIVDNTEIVNPQTIGDTSTNENSNNVKMLEQLKLELSRKNDEIEDYKYQLSENTYPSIIQALQDQVNKLYDEKSELERSLDELTEKLSHERKCNDEKTATIEKLENQREIDDANKQTIDSRNDKTYSAVLNAKDVEIQNLKVEIEDKGVRFRELHDHYESAEIEINSMRSYLMSKDEEIRSLTLELDSTRKELQLLKRALKNEISVDGEFLRSGENVGSSTSGDFHEQTSTELDVALYMLHQRDVKVEELTHELMQLLEERDTLQLRLSDAIRVNEEIRRSLTDGVATTSDGTGENVVVEPLVQQPSPSKSVGPVEIAKEAIDSPTEEKGALDQNYETLSTNLKSIAFEVPSWLSSNTVDLSRSNDTDALIAVEEKLSQLRNMGHRRDVRLMDDRESRHNQQMSLITHRDVLSTLPPEAAARLVNANYTLSRDVQSQSSVLMNWLWGKSTPKVVHM